MKEIEKFFMEKTKDLGFIELKEEAKIGIDNLKIKDTPLPVITDKLVKEIEEGRLDDELDLASIIEGIIYLMGADPDFPYIEDYKNILLAYNDNIGDLILHQAAEHFQAGDLTSSGLWLRSLLLLEPNNIDGLFNYGLILEEIGKDRIAKDKKAEGDLFIKGSTSQFESILDIDEDYGLAYYKLGYHYKHFERYMKASLMWNKFLPLSQDQMLSQEIREELVAIKDDAYFETGFTYLNFNDYDKALEAFLKLLPNHKDSWNVNLLIGQSYMGLGQYENAIGYLEEAISLNKGETDIYNDLGIIYFNIGNINKAVEVFTEGINNCEEDYKLYFNRGLGYLQLENYGLAIEDINKAYELNPSDPNIAEQKSLLDGHL